MPFIVAEVEVMLVAESVVAVWLAEEEEELEDDEEAPEELLEEEELEVESDDLHSHSFTVPPVLLSKVQLPVL